MTWSTAEGPHASGGDSVCVCVCLRVWRELGCDWRVFITLLLQVDKAILKAARTPSPPGPKSLWQQQLQATSCLGGGEE